jgi:hypothetical protein
MSTQFSANKGSAMIIQQIFCAFYLIGGLNLPLKPAKKIANL